MMSRSLFRFFRLVYYQSGRWGIRVLRFYNIKQMKGKKQQQQNSRYTSQCVSKPEINLSVNSKKKWLPRARLEPALAWPKRLRNVLPTIWANSIHFIPFFFRTAVIIEDWTKGCCTKNLFLDRLVGNFSFFSQIYNFHLNPKSNIIISI